MFKSKELIIFDMDGTLIDSAPSLANSINFMLKELGLRELEFKVIRDFIGNGADNLIRRALVGKKEFESSNIDENYYKKAREIFFRHYGSNLNHNTLLYPNVLDTLEYLKSKDYKLALATNKPIEFVGEMLEHFKIDKFFDITLGGGLVEFKKPHPQMLNKICQDLSCNAKDAVMVGDSSNDILAAKRANMDSIALTYGYNQGINLKELEPTVICNDFGKLKEFF